MRWFTLGQKKSRRRSLNQHRRSLASKARRGVRPRRAPAQPAALNRAQETHLFSPASPPSPGFYPSGILMAFSHEMNIVIKYSGHLSAVEIIYSDDHSSVCFRSLVISFMIDMSANEMRKSILQHNVLHVTLNFPVALRGSRFESWMKTLFDAAHPAPSISSDSITSSADSSELISFALRPGSRDKSSRREHKSGSLRALQIAASRAHLTLSALSCAIGASSFFASASYAIREGGQF